MVSVSHDKPLGLLVDGVSDIVGIDSGNVTSSGADEMWSSDLVEGIATVGEQLIPLLALENFTGSRLPALPQAA